jgi:hypothetical protein
MPNSEFNLLVLTIYFLCVTYVLYQMVNSFNDEYTIKVLKDELEEQLDKHDLKDRVEVSFKFDSRYEINNEKTKLKDLSITVKNKSQDFPIYVDWDRSSMTDWFGDGARRIIRTVPGNPLDLTQAQVSSVVSPGRSLSEKIAAEDVQERKEPNGPITVAKNLINISKPPSFAPDAKKKGYKEFMEGQAPIFFTLDLAMRLIDRDAPQNGYPVQVRCKFQLNRLHWTAGLPWNPKK